MLFSILFLLLNDKSPDFVDAPFNWVTLVILIIIFGGAEIAHKIDSNKRD